MTHLLTMPDGGYRMDHPHEWKSDPEPYLAWVLYPEETGLPYLRALIRMRYPSGAACTTLEGWATRHTFEVYSLLDKMKPRPEVQYRTAPHKPYACEFSTLGGYPRVYVRISGTGYGARDMRLELYVQRHRVTPLAKCMILAR